MQFLKYYKIVIYLNADSDKIIYICAGNSATRLNFLFMFKIRIYQGCFPEGEFVEMQIPFDLFPKFVFNSVVQGHCVSVIDVTDNEKDFIKFNG